MFRPRKLLKRPYRADRPGFREGADAEWDPDKLCETVRTRPHAYQRVRSRCHRCGECNCHDNLRKEVIQPQVPLRLPCYDFTPVADPTVVPASRRLAHRLRVQNQLSWCDGRCVQGPGTYSPRHADPRLLAIPTSCSRVADLQSELRRLFGISSTSRLRCPLYHHCSTCVAQPVRAMRT